jgi:CO/xanthine dehydrogenase FAD-binding subunit
LDEALVLMEAHGADAQVIAGGTDLLVERKFGAGGPRLLIDISRLSELKGIRLTDAGLEIGAATTHSDIAQSSVIASWCPVLAEAAHAIGAVQTRNLGTIGGNLVTCVPSMDSGPALLALDASICLASRAGRRRIGLDSFFVGPRKTALMPDELLTSILVPRENLGTAMCFLKFGLRKGQALALVNVAAGFSLEPLDGSLRKPRIALGAVAPTVIRARQAEAYLAARVWSLETAGEAGRIAATEARPIDDFRASAAYRRKLIAVLTRRALEEAWRRTERRQDGVAA